jgi:uncharacterized protein DUF6404
MTHDEKIEYLLKDLGERGISKYTVAPPLYRLLWGLGIEVTPPHFAGFWSLAPFMGAFFAIAWGLFMWVAAWRDLPFAVTLVASLIAGFLFGTIMAGYYRWRARALALPSWQDYPAAS